MTSEPGRKTPPVCLGIVVFAALAVILGRGAFWKEGPPIFFPDHSPSLRVELGPAFENPGVYQFSDGQTFNDVIIMTLGRESAAVPLAAGCDALLSDGSLLDIVLNDKKAAQIRCGWMPASHRMALGIALHPDHMSLQDWTALPGLGEKMAARIELDRQENGDFGRIEALSRVRGIGDKRIASWKEFF